ncbi:YpdA family putative bacillithiol disulfide reductase [Flavihumibacter petaseus]|uniref:Putative oxidoreductase n=1 Tax=Flavihumibacter petaseus NBRC 106054 TaxID=1220578 RepID=A0A0E9N287_9BACT|nr:YpdA family putative bacillithiol disulfide reductase [Flavihumibacter petaseus]GAO43430.1 putative oxidoreductase [Flavihumibacter petaseus NBRC 106054]
MTNDVYDVLIIGGGPIGLACGLEAKKAKLSYVILEKGCLVNSLYHYPANMTFFSTSERLEIGNVPFVSNNAKPTRAEALEYYRRVTTSFELNIRLFEKVTGVERQNGWFAVTSIKEQYKARHIIIATGFFDIPYKLKVPGEELAKVTHYYQDPHFYAFQDVVVVGAQNSAVDAALETWRKGARVTMIIRQEEVGKRVKYWVRPDIINRIKEGSIKAYFSSSITAIREREVDIATPDGPITLPNDWIIAMTGYEPNLAFLESVGVELSLDESRRPILHGKTQESSVSGIYLAGVICGGMDTHSLFIENSRIHAKRIISDVKRRRNEVK